MTGRGDWGDGGDLAKVGGKKGRKSGSWKDISSPGPLVCSPLCPWPLPPQCRGQLPSSPAVPSSVKRQSPGHPRVRSRWWGSGRPPPPRASISALEPPGSEQRACVGVGLCSHPPPSPSPAPLPRSPRPPSVPTRPPSRLQFLPEFWKHGMCSLKTPS